MKKRAVRCNRVLSGFALILTTSFGVVAEEFEFGFAAALMGPASDIGRAITLDSSNNVYTTGSFQQTVDFDPGSGVYTLGGGLSGSVFIQKSDSAGGFLWARGLGAPGTALGEGIATDASGFVYTTGRFAGTGDFDPGPGTANLSTSGNIDFDIFVSKLDSNGNFVWAKSMGGLDGDVGLDIDVDHAGNTYITGFFNGTADFDPGPGIFNLIAPAGSNAFVTKLDSNGDFVWAKSFNSVPGIRGRAVVVDAASNVYSTGEFVGTADFDPGPGIFNLAGNAGRQIYVSKLDTAGNFIWAKATDSNDASSEVIPYGIDLDGYGNVYTAGEFAGVVDFDPGPSTTVVSGIGPRHAFIWKLTNTSDFAWAKAIGGGGDAIAYDIAVNGDGIAYATGNFSGPTDFDPTSGTEILTPDDCDAFVVRLTEDGDLWTVGVISGPFCEFGFGIALDGAGNAYTTGAFAGTVDFDPGPGIVPIVGTSPGDIYISKLELITTAPATNAVALGVLIVVLMLVGYSLAKRDKT